MKELETTSIFSFQLLFSHQYFVTNMLHGSIFEGTDGTELCSILIVTIVAIYAMEGCCCWKSFQPIQDLINAAQPRMHMFTLEGFKLGCVNNISCSDSVSNSAACTVGHWA